MNSSNVSLYNTLTRSVEEIQPIDPSKLTVYTCGPTVYDYAHIGHWFNYVRMDTLIRALRPFNQSVQWVMNITDVGHLVSDADEGEDKLEKGAKREGKTAWEVAEFYMQDFLECMKLLQMWEPTHIVKATDHIQEQIELIQALESKGYTYVIDDGVYYDTSKFEGYAAFARLDLDDQREGARVMVNPQKRNASDFALWKFSPKDSQRDMEWNSPWGKGFPGWHIECSAMSMKYLGDTLDIHTGGIDHVPVHHTNEIAQSEAATGKRFANYWMHSNHVMVEGEKISKSLGNGIRLQEIIEKGFTPQEIRLYILESHYRTNAHFNWSGLQAAKNRLQGYRAVAALKWQGIDANLGDGKSTYVVVDGDVASPIFNDLNTPQALANISQRFDEFSDRLVSKACVEDFSEYLETVDEYLELGLNAVPDITDDQKRLLEARERSREQQDWEEADKLRTELESQGVGLRDTPHGAIWYPL